MTRREMLRREGEVACFTESTRHSTKCNFPTTPHLTLALSPPGSARVLRLDRRVHADLAKRIFFSVDDFSLAAFSPHGRSMPEEVVFRSRSRRDGTEYARRFHNTLFLSKKSFRTMTNTEQDRWSRVKGRLRSSVGEDVYTSWFARMDLEGVQDESVHLSVPTRFLKSWIQAH